MRARTIARSFASPPLLGFITILGSGVVTSPLVAQKYVAPTNETISTRIEEGYGSRPSQVIWIYNGSTVPVDVYSVTLRDCENVRQDCAPHPLRMHLPPSHSEVLARVEPQDPERGFTFRYSYGWRADSAYMAALHVLAAGGDKPAVQQMAAQQTAAAEERATVGSHDMILGPQELAVLGPKIVRIGVQPDSVTLQVGQSFLMREVRVLAYDLQGNLLGRVASYQGHMTQGVINVHGDTATAQRPGRARMEFQVAVSATPLTTTLPIIVAKPDTTR